MLDENLSTSFTLFPPTYLSFFKIRIVGCSEKKGHIMFVEVVITCPG